MIALIDGDVYTRRFTAAAQYTIYQMTDGEEIRSKTKADAYIEENPGVKVLDVHDIISPLEYVKHSINLSVMDILDQTGADFFHIYIGERGGKNFRHRLYPEYKGNRKDMKKPVHYEAIHNWLVEKYEATICYDIEADDALGIATSRYSDWVICSNDKDMLQIPGKHYNMVTKERLQISELGANKRLFKQILMGDGVDNIKGIPKVGEKKAHDLIWHLDTFERMCDASITAYTRYYGDEGYDMFILNGSLCYLLRKQGDSFEKFLERNKYGVREAKNV